MPVLSKADREWIALKARNLSLPIETVESAFMAARHHTQQRANAPLVPSKPQKPCDHGLFSDDADQLDLVEMFQQPTNEE